MDKRGEDECWPWIGRSVILGYGSIWIQNRQIKSNRLALILGSGGEQLLQANHHCDNRICCNPKHLYWGTEADNIRDLVTRNKEWHAIMKDRGLRARKLLDSQVSYIKLLVGKFSDGQIGRWYLVNPETIRSIRLGVRYNEIPAGKIIEFAK